MSPGADRRALARRACLGLFGLAILIGVAGRIIPAARPFDQRVTQAWRESDYVEIARNFDREGLNPAYPRIDWRRDTPGYVEMEFPFIPWVGGALSRVYGFHVEYMRGLASLAALGALALFYGLCRKLLSRAAAFYATALFSLNWMVIELGGALQPDGLMIFLSILTFSLLWRWWTEPSTGRLLCVALAVCGAILAKAPAAALGIVIAYAVLARQGPRALLRPGVQAAAVLAIAPPLLWYLWARELWLTYGNSLGLSNETHLIGLDMLWPPSFLVRLLAQQTLKVLTPLGWIALVAAAFVSRPGIRLAWVWYGSFWLFLLVAARTTGDAWAFYYHAGALPPAYLLVGAGIEALLGKSEPGGIGRASRWWGPPLGHFVGLGAAAMLLVSGAVHLRNLRSSWKGDLGEMYACAQEMKRVVPEDARIVTGGISGFDEYGKPVAHDMPMLFAWMDRRGFSYPAEELGFENLDGFARRGGRYWIATQEEVARLGGRAVADRHYRWISDCDSRYSVFRLPAASSEPDAAPSHTLNASPSGVE